MALTDVNAPGLNSSGQAFDPRTFRDSSAVPYEALDRLPTLHGEASRNMQLSQFLARSPQACLVLMLAGAVALIWAGGGSLKADFTWVLLVLIGIIAMTRNYIRGFARSLRRVPLQEAASDLRVLLLYTGAAWGAGAFLVMPGLPAPTLAFAFAAGPSLACALILRDEIGVIAFVGPAAMASATAAMLGAWPFDIWVAGTILVTGMAIACLSMLQCAMRVRRHLLPALH
jgi:hypothetical protein